MSDCVWLCVIWCVWYPLLRYTQVAQLIISLIVCACDFPCVFSLLPFVQFSHVPPQLRFVRFCIFLWRRGDRRYYVARCFQNYPLSIMSRKSVARCFIVRLMFFLWSILLILSFREGVVAMFLLRYLYQQALHSWFGHSWWRLWSSSPQGDDHQYLHVPLASPLTSV